MSNEEHEHDWSSWSEWRFGGHDTDMRERYCGQHVDPEYRTHVHHPVRRDDIFAPVGSGLTVSVCGGPSGCGRTLG